MKLPKLKAGDLVSVEWLDAFGASNAWMDVDDVLEMGEYPVKSVGYWLGDEKRYIAMCGGMTSGAFERVFKIPKGMIVKIRRVRGY